MVGGLSNSFQEHVSVGEAAFGLFQEHLPVDEWAKEAADRPAKREAEGEDHEPDELYEVAEDHRHVFIEAWSEVRALLEEEGYETKEFHEQVMGHSSGATCAWCHPDLDGTWQIVGPDGDPWFGEGSPNPVFQAFFDQAREQLPQPVFEAAFPMSDYETDGEA